MRKRPGGVCDLILVMLFCAAIFLPLFSGLLLEDSQRSPGEKRVLATLPEIPGDLSAMAIFPEAFTRYYSDHFGFRGQFVHWYKKWKYFLGDSPSEDVIRGQDGWLFLGSVKEGYTKYNDPVDDFRGVNKYSAEQLEEIAAYFRALSAWLEARGIRYVLLIGPNKHTIYPEKLPSFVRRLDVESATDQLVRTLRKETDILIVDPRNALMGAKNRQQLYYKTDTHWNAYAADIVQKMLFNVIKQMFSNQIEDVLYRVETFPRIKVGGDLAELIANAGLTEKGLAPVFMEACLPTVIYPKNTPRPVIVSTCNKQQLKALIFRDSFCNALQPFIVRSFRSCTFIWEKLTCAALQKYIDAEQPDIVIEEWAERTLPFVPADRIRFELLYLQQLFEDSHDLIFSNKWDALTFNEQLTVVRQRKDSLSLHSSGIDPIILLPTLPIQGGRSYVIHLRLESTLKSGLKLFYSDGRVGGYPFSEERVLQVSVNTGENDIYLLLDSAYLGGQIRIDPIAATGRFELKELEIRDVSEVD